MVDVQNRRSRRIVDAAERSAAGRVHWRHVPWLHAPVAGRREHCRHCQSRCPAASPCHTSPVANCPLPPCAVFTAMGLPALELRPFCHYHTACWAGEAWHNPRRDCPDRPRAQGRLADKASGSSGQGLPSTRLVCPRYSPPFAAVSLVTGEARLARPSGSSPSDEGRHGTGGREPGTHRMAAQRRQILHPCPIATARLACSGSAASWHCSAFAWAPDPAPLYDDVRPRDRVRAMHQRRALRTGSAAAASRRPVRQPSDTERLLCSPAV